MGGGTKTTKMVLTVDLQCCSCYKKVKKILCKFPQIRDQVYDEKANKVTITVVCCDPEKIRDKLCCTGCGVIKSIEIKEPPKPDPPKPDPPKPDPPKPDPPKPDPPKPDPPKPDPPKPDPPKPDPPKPDPQPSHSCPSPPPGYCCGQCFEGHTGGPCYQWWYGRPIPPALGYCCGQCFEGHTGGPCYQLYGRPVPPPPCYDNYGYRPVPYGYGRGCYVSKCDKYFSDENATGCSIM